MFHASSAEEVSGTHWGPAPHHLHKFVSDSMHDTAPQGEHPGYRLPPEPIPFYRHGVSDPPGLVPA